MITCEQENGLFHAVTTSNMCDDIAAVNVRQSDVTHDVQMYERCLEDVARRLVHSVMEQKVRVPSPRPQPRPQP